MVHGDDRYSKYFPTPISEKEAEEELRSYNEQKEMISRLPRKYENTNTGGICSYQGFCFEQNLLLGVLSSQKHFKPLPGDIFLNAYPKSGTTWIKALAFAVVNRRAFPCSDPNHPLLTTSPQKCVLHFEDVFSRPRVPDLTVLPRPRMFASHVPFSLLPDSVKDSSRIVYVSRDPKDVLISLLHFHNQICGPLVPQLTVDQAFDNMVEGNWVFDPIWEHQIEYKRESLKRPDKVLFLQYEEMQETPNEHVRKLASFLGLPFTVEEEAAGVVEEIVSLCSFNFLKELRANKEGIHAESKDIFCTKNSSFFRKGKVGDWKQHLTPEMAERIDQITREKLNQLID